MSALQPTRYSDFWVWMLVCLLATVFVFTVLTRVAGAVPGEPRETPVTSTIVSPSDGTFIAGAYPGADPYVSVGSKVELGAVVGHVEDWGKLHPVTSMVRGTVTEVLISDDAMVTTLQPLFTVQLEKEPTPA